MFLTTSSPTYYKVKEIKTVLSPSDVAALPLSFLAGSFWLFFF